MQTSSNENFSCDKDALEKMIGLVEKVCFDVIHIFLGNPEDLIKMDMSKIPKTYYFISKTEVKRGSVFMVVEEHIKEALYIFCKEHPDRVFRGELEERR